MDGVASGVDCVAPSIEPNNLNEVLRINLADKETNVDDDIDTYSFNTQYSTRLENLDS